MDENIQYETVDMVKLIEEDGTVFEYEGQTIFYNIKRFVDGSTVIQLEDYERYHPKRCVLVEANGNLFSFEDQVEFDSIERFGNGSTKIIKSPKECYLVKSDNTLLDDSPSIEITYNEVTGRTKFLKKSEFADKTFEILLLKDGTRFSYDDIDIFETISDDIYGGILMQFVDNKKYSYILPDRTLFEYNGITVFDNFEIYFAWGDTHNIRFWKDDFHIGFSDFFKKFVKEETIVEKGEE